MFTFGNFSKNCEGYCDERIDESNLAPAVEIKSDPLRQPNQDTHHFKINEIDIHYLDQTKILQNLIKTDSSIMEAEKNHSDLVEGVYEGGLKIWECTYDVANYLCNQNRILLSGKHVLDLGCGLGILGILAYKLGAANVHYQDYNEGIIKHLTIPNVMINGEKIEKSRFWSGDWKNFIEVNDLKYDVILTSETIYNPRNQKKLLEALKTLLKPDGTIILAGKSYYFGVGGGMKQFLDLVEKDRTLCYENLWESAEGLKRELILMRFR
ncbi:histidine protein methyltransferase 1 homolog [Rhodnius prolixus]|uniref:histidine protein methyltransferase 1 homolog n=1 Tax=Rhodnius prolixus TaxID=13249 RepID=UPI003D187E68